HRDKVARQCATVTQRVKCGYARAEQRRGFGSVQAFGYRDKRFDRRQHVLLISSVITDTGNLLIPAIPKVSSPALETRAVMTTVPADTDTLSLFPLGNTGAQLVDETDDFVSRNSRKLYSGPQALFRQRVAVANTASLYLNAHLSCAGHRGLAFYNFEVRPGRGNLRNFHWRRSNFRR